MVSYFIRMKGLPWHSTVSDVQNFFGKVELQPEWIHIIKMPDGRDSGEALVGVSSQEHFEMCLKQDKQFMGKRYIELYEATEEEWTRITNRVHRTNSVPIKKNSFIVLMRGLPYSAQEDDCISFFENTSCLGVHLTKDRYGRPSGQGYAEFATEDLMNKALEFDRKHMQNRYIELFKSNVKELVSAMSNTQNRLQETPKYRNESNANQSHVNNVHLKQNRPGYYNNSEPRTYPIQILGLDSSVTECSINEFFEKIQASPVRIHRRADGAEVFVEFPTVEMAKIALARDKYKIKNKVMRIFPYNYKTMISKVNPEVHVFPRKNVEQTPYVKVKSFTQENYNGAYPFVTPERSVANQGNNGTASMVQLSNAQQFFSPLLPASPANNYNFPSGYQFSYQLASLPITPSSHPQPTYVFPATPPSQTQPLIYPATRIPPASQQTSTTPTSTSSKTQPPHSYVYTPRQQRQLKAKYRK